MPAPHLPLELLDPIVDLVCDSQAVLRNSCLISKSWIQPARRHLFANIRFHTVERLRSWRETFPDPSKSPARYAKILIVDCIQAVTAADAEASGWIRGFSSVVRLALREESRDTNGPMISLLPFHGFSPVIKSLPVDFYSLPPSQVFDLILSFPLLEDLHVITRDEFKVNNGDGYYRRLLITVQPPNQPMNGYLELSQLGGIRFIASGLLSLPSGIHFRRLALKWSMPEDISLTMALVEGCSHTLEYLEIACGFLPGWWPDSIDLSKAIRLKGWPFGSNRRGLTGSQLLSERSHPSIRIFNKLQYTYPTTRDSQENCRRPDFRGVAGA